jgi:hypothetical protein
MHTHASTRDAATLAIEVGDPAIVRPFELRGRDSGEPWGQRHHHPPTRRLQRRRPRTSPQPRLHRRRHPRTRRRTPHHRLPRTRHHTPTHRRRTHHPRPRPIRARARLHPRHPHHAHPTRQPLPRRPPRPLRGRLPRRRIASRSAATSRARALNRNRQVAPVAAPCRQTEQRLARSGGSSMQAVAKREGSRAPLSVPHTLPSPAYSLASIWRPAYRFSWSSRPGAPMADTWALPKAQRVH